MEKAKWDGLFWFARSSYLTNNILLTDTDLFIADMNLHNADQKLTFRSLTSHLIGITITNTTIEDIELFFDGDNISILIENSIIQYPQISSSQPVIFHNCIFSGDTDTSSELTPHKMIYLFVSYTTAEFYNCNVTGININRNDKFMICFYGNVTMLNVAARQNEGIFLQTEECNVQITDSYFRNNKGPKLLYVRENQLTFKNSHLSNNTNEYGEIFLYESNAHMVNSSFTRNQGVNSGSVTAVSSHLTTEGCQFLKNTAKAKGGAIHVISSTYNDHSSLFLNNFAGEGGKILNHQNLFLKTFKMDRHF